MKTVHELHKLGIFHRDIKPSNILYDHLTKQIKIIDFGFADFYNSPYVKYIRGGTPGYIAPEILNFVDYNEKVDIFSCGIILLYILTGQCLFDAETKEEIM